MTKDAIEKGARALEGLSPVLNISMRRAASFAILDAVGYFERAVDEEHLAARLERMQHSPDTAWCRTQSSLTETARREVHMHLSCELRDEEAAEEWYEMALAAGDTVEQRSEDGEV